MLSSGEDTHSGGTRANALAVIEVIIKKPAGDYFVAVIRRNVSLQP